MVKLSSGLFVELQLSAKRAVDTAGLTRSFGWGGNDVFVQHDAQELFGVLLETLCARTKGHPLHDAILSAFQLTNRDCLTCQTCGNNRRRQDVTYGISVGVRGFSHLTASLTSYVQPELLEGPNAVMCSTCGSKQPSSRDTRFDTLSDVITLQLKRFEMDWETMGRIKLADEFAFGAELDMSPYVSKEAADAAMPGSLVYDLYSILMHEGDPALAHYYAYIRDQSTNKWYRFDDTDVTELTGAEVHHLFAYPEPPAQTLDGTAATTHGCPFQNAYMLMYQRRAADPKEAAAPPLSMATEIQKQNAVFLESKVEHDRGFHAVRVTVHYRGKQRPLNIATSRQNTPFRTVIENALQAMALQADYNDVRMRHMDFARMLPTEPLLNCDDLMLSDLNFPPFQVTHLWLEVRSDGDFSTYRPELLALHLFELDTSPALVTEDKYTPELLDQCSYKPSVILYLDPAARVRDLRQQAAMQMQMNVQNVLLVFLTSEAATIWDTTFDAKFLRNQLRMSSGEKIYCERCADYTQVRTKSVVVEKFQNAANLITMEFNVLHESNSIQELEIDIRSSLFELRMAIAQRLGVEPGSFKIRRQEGDRELKEADKPLGFFGIIDLKIRKGSVFLERGAPLLPGEVQLSVFIISVSDEKQPLLLPVGSVLAHELWTNDQLKVALSALYGAPPSQLIRVCEKTGNKVGKPWFDGRVLRENCAALKDGKEIVIKHIAAPEHLIESHILLDVYRFSPSSRSLSAVAELAVEGVMTIPQLKAKLVELSNLPQSSAANQPTHASSFESPDPANGNSLVAPSSEVIPWLKVIKVASYKLNDPASLIASSDWALDVSTQENKPLSITSHHLTADSILTGPPWRLKGSGVVVYCDSRELAAPAAAPSASRSRPGASSARRGVPARPEVAVKFFSSEDRY